jgi:hypothetical protein
MKLNANNIDLAWGNPVKGLSIAIFMGKSHFSKEEPVTAEIILANNGKEVVGIVETHILRDFQFTITRGKGISEKLQMTIKGQQTLHAVNSLPAAKRRYIVLNPDEIYRVTDHTDLREWFVLTDPGEYSIEVSKNDWEENGDTLKSGIVVFFIERKELKKHIRSNEKYPVLAWTADEIRTGTWEAHRLDLNKIINAHPLHDIRNCTVASERRICAVAGINKRTKAHELWIISLDKEDAQPLIRSEQMLMNAISPTGKLICYTGLPANDENGASLYLFDRASGTSALLLKGDIHRDCIPSWLPSSDGVLYHTNRNKIMEWDIKDQKATFLFDGSYPAISWDGSLIAFRKGDQLMILARGTGETRELSIHGGFWRGRLRNGISWSPDDRYLLLGYSSGVFGYEMAFCTIEVATAKRRKIRKRSRGEAGMIICKQ